MSFLLYALVQYFLTQGGCANFAPWKTFGKAWTGNSCHNTGLLTRFWGLSDLEDSLIGI